ncbi:unnamed protein product [Rotaria sordida]|uniref:Uncharacterized protein n=1 Tax=Rotaria sordida TaxID=392033 RepID=A0A814GW59_9BILA|nr:unnamed protein product [Rotaria sordida]
MLAVECLFYPDEFILRNNIDYKKNYLSKYYNPLRLKQRTFCENNDSFEYIIDNDQNYSGGCGMGHGTSFVTTIDGVIKFIH